MTYDEANAALHALRDAGYDVLLVANGMNEETGELLDCQVYPGFYPNRHADKPLTQSEIDRLIADADKESPLSD